MKLDLFNGDCLEVMNNIPDGSIDAIICDPPYGTTACAWDSIIHLESMWSQINRVIKDDGAIVLFGSQPFTSILITSNLKGFKYEWIWEKSKSGSAFTAKYNPIKKHENVLVFSKTGKKTVYNPQMTEGEPYSRVHKSRNMDKNNHKYGFSAEDHTHVNDGFRFPSSVQFFQQKWRRQDQLHPTQKPVELMEYLIKTYTNDGETVLDFTMGSGTTGVACVNTNRNFVGIELDKTYFDIATKRIKDATIANKTLL